MYRVIGRLISYLLLTVVLVGSAVASAEDISFEATVNDTQITLKDALELTLTVRGSKADGAAIPMPAIEGFELRYVGPSDKFTFINGVSSSEHSYIYNLFPLRVGHFQIPSIMIKIDGKEYYSKPIDITVEDKSTAVNSKLNDIESKAQETIEDKVFVKGFIKHPVVYVGQKTPLQIKVYVKDLSLQLAAAPSLKPNGFTTDATCNMQQSKEVINGMSYQTLIFDTNIYPTRPGRITVGPFEAQGQLVYRVKQQGSDLLSDFFGIQETRPITLQGEAVTLQAVELPSEGQPKDFSGAVGQFDFKASVGPNLIKLGDPLTFKVKLTGQGNLKEAVVPQLKDAALKRYEPQIKDTEDSRTIEQVVIPIDPKMKELAEISFSYFDPQEAKYKTITQGPFPITIMPVTKAEEFKAYGFVDKSKGSEALKIDGMNGVFYKTGLFLVKMIRDWKFWFGLFILGISWVGFIFWQRFQRKVKSDEAFAKRLKASNEARKGMTQVEECLKQNNEKDFYDALYRVLANYLADKLQKPSAGLSYPMVEKEIMQLKPEQEYVEKIKGIFEKCDYVRFAAGKADQAKMQEDFQHLQQIIAYLNKKLK